jgi:hypothetical protein
MTVSDFKFEFDENAFKKVADKAVTAKMEETQALLDRLHRDYSGKPVSEVKPALVRAWKKDGGNISDAEATDWATLISDGTRIVLKR